MNITGIIINGGSRVHTMLDRMWESLEVNNMESMPFSVEMADHYKAQPLGILRDVTIKIIKKHSFFDSLHVNSNG